MTIDTKALRERLPSFDFEIDTRSSEMVSAADGEYVLAADAHELLGAAADRLAALEADKAQLISDLEDALQAGLAASVEAHRLEAENQRLRAQQAPLNGTINKLRRENERLRGAVEATLWDTERFLDEIPAILRSRWRWLEARDIEKGLAKRRNIYIKALAAGGDQ